MHKSLVTPPEIEQLAEQVLTQLHGQLYVNAMYALDVAQQRLSRELERLNDQHVFSHRGAIAAMFEAGEKAMREIAPTESLAALSWKQSAYVSRSAPSAPPMADRTITLHSGESVVLADGTTVVAARPQGFKVSTGLRAPGVSALAPDQVTTGTLQRVFDKSSLAAPLASGMSATQTSGDAAIESGHAGKPGQPPILGPGLRPTRSTHFEASGEPRAQLTAGFGLLLAATGLTAVLLASLKRKP